MKRACDRDFYACSVWFENIKIVCKILFNEEGDFHSGALILVDKPLKWTSFDVVNKIRWCLKSACGKIKVGHAGTLDPLATGLVIVCTGKWTKRIEDYMAQEKEYVATLCYGAVTPSFDLETLPEGVSIVGISIALI